MSKPLPNLGLYEMLTGQEESSEKVTPALRYVVVQRVAKALYEMNPARPILPVRGADTFPFDHPFAHAQRALAMRQAEHIWAMLAPYTPMHEHRSRPMHGRIAKFDPSIGFADIDRAIQSALETMREREGIPSLNVDSEQTWSEIEGIVLLDLDIDEGLYWAPVTG